MEDAAKTKQKKYRGDINVINIVGALKRSNWQIVSNKMRLPICPPLDKGCNHRKPAFILANAVRKKHGHGHFKTKKLH
jgi:hypothetical protein